MKKKIFSVMLVAALAISTLAGCNNKSDKGTENQKQTEVTEATETAEEKTVSADGIKVTGSMGTAEKVEMSAVTDGDDYKAATDFVATLTDKSITATEVYNINLLDKFGVKAQPDGKVNISLALSDNMANAEGDGYEVYRKEDDNTFTKLTVSIKEKEISFDTEHFSIYVLVKTSSGPLAVGEPDSEAADNGEADQAQIEAAENNPNAFTFTSKNVTMYVTNTVNVRTGPDSYFDKLASLSKGQAVTVLAQCNETGWYQIDIGDSVASFVCNDYLSTEAPKQNTSSASNNTASNNNSSNNTQNNAPAQDSTPAQQPAEQPAAPEPQQPAQPNNCPYPLLTVTTYNGMTGFFYTLDQAGTDESFEAYRQACIAVGAGNNGSMHVGTFDDTGDVYFCHVFN